MGLLVQCYCTFEHLQNKWLLTKDHLYNHYSMENIPALCAKRNLGISHFKKYQETPDGNARWKIVAT